MDRDPIGRRAQSLGNLRKIAASTGTRIGAHLALVPIAGRRHHY
jgi:hypothetical protein